MSTLNKENLLSEDSLDYDYLADWIKSHNLTIKKGGMPDETATDAVMNLLTSTNKDATPSRKFKAVQLFMKSAGYDDDLDSILATTQMPLTTENGVSIGGNTISTEYLPSYSTDAQNAYASELESLNNMVKAGAYDYNRGEYEYGKTVDDFIDTDAAAQVKNAQDTAFQKDWLGGNDYGAQINQAQAGTNKYQSIYDEALTAMNQDRDTDYSLWKDNADYMQDQSDRSYQRALDKLTALQYNANKEATQNQNVLDTLSNLGISYAELMANQGMNNGTFLDQLSDSEYQRLTGQTRTNAANANANASSTTGI